MILRKDIILIRVDLVFSYYKGKDTKIFKNKGNS